MAGPLYMVFHKDKVTLGSHPNFPTRIVHNCHLNQLIYLPVFFPSHIQTRGRPKLHTLDVVRALSYYPDEIRPFRSFPRLFVASADRVKIVQMGI